MKSVSTLILLLLSVLVVAQQRIHVHSGASGQQNGQSWANAFNNLHQAFALAQAGDEVWVAAGIYRPDTAYQRNRSFVMPSGVRLLGGFSGTETTENERNPVAYPTILSGNIGASDDSTDNAFTVLYMAFPDSNTYVSGFILEHGYAHSDTAFGNVSPTRTGGAVYILANDSTAYPFFDRCIFRHNFAAGNGGAVMVRGRFTVGCAPRFRNCRFWNNRCAYNGGAIWYQGGSDYDTGVKFEGCDFEYNRAGTANGTIAGAVYYWKVYGADTLSFKKCRFVNNQANAVAGCINVECSVPGKFVTLDSCFISGNKVLSTFTSIPKPCFLNLEGISSNSHYRYIRISHNHFYEQPGPAYGQIIYGSSSLDTSSIGEFSHNIFQKSSGIVSLGVYKNIHVANNTISDADSLYIGLSGKQVSVHSNIFTADKNSIYLNSEDTGFNVRFYNNIIANAPTAPNFRYANPVSWYGYEDNIQDTIYLLNNIILNGQFRQYPYDTAPPLSQKIYVHNNIFMNNRDADTGVLRLPFWHEPFDMDFDNNLTDIVCNNLSGSVVCGNHNLLSTENPFADTAIFDFHLKACSPAINAGNSVLLSALGITRDLSGTDRIQSIAPDIGPYEHTPLSLSTTLEAFPTCANSAQGYVEASASGGCAPYTYTWNGGTGIPATGLPASLFRLTVTDALGHIAISEVVVPVADSPVIPVFYIIPTAPGASSGAVILEPSGGTAPYTAVWNTGQQGLEINGLTDGNYAVTVTDANGCTVTGTYFVTVVSADEADNTPLLQVFPNPVTDHLYIHANTSLHLRLSDEMGREVAGFTHYWEPGDFVSTAFLPSGIYWLVATSQNSTTTVRLVKK